MAAAGRKPPTQAEVMVLFVALACFGCLVLHALVTGWVWIPGRSGWPASMGYWTSRVDDPRNYFTYLAIIGAATLGLLVGALVRSRQLQAQNPRR